MWALRRASLPLRNKNGLRVGVSQSHFADSELPMNQIQCPFECSHVIRDDKPLSLKRFYCRQTVCGNAHLARREFSSKPGAGGTESVFEDGFSELETSGSSKTYSENTDDNDNVVKPSQWERPNTELFHAIVDSEGLSVREAVDKWVAEGNSLTSEEVHSTMQSFRSLRMIRKALELSECLEKNDQFEYDETCYIKHVDLIAKVHGLEKAEAYIETIPDSCRGILAYQALLANYARYSRVKKAEELFQKMRDLGFPVTVFSCNQLLVLYKRHDKKKIADVLLLMEKENVKPSLTTYKHLMDLRCKSGDTKGTEEIFETMQSEGIEPDTQARFIMARCYAFAGIKDKAEALLKEIEGSNLEENRRVCRSLLLLYGLLGKADEVERIWKVCETDPHFLEGMAAITAWGKLKKVEAAEAVFDRLLRTRTLRSNVCYSALLKVYADNKLLAKSENLVKRMSKDGFRTGPLDWNSLVRLYLEAGEVEKADFMFMKLTQRNSRKPPLLSTYVAIMRQYAKRGDIHNSEKMFYRIKKAGYTIELSQFEHLIEAYINANKPAYGIWERMKAENIFPSQIFIRRLHQLDPFRTTAASYLLG